MKQNFYLKMLLATLLLPFCFHTAMAQNNVIQGTVYDTDGKTPMVGVTVTVKGTTVGVITTSDGTYKLRIPAGAGGGDPTLVFSSLGYDTQEIAANKRTQIDITMHESSIKVDDVVVTALGVTRAEKSLGYAVTKLDSEAINQSVSSNWLNGLAGKVAGLNFDSASSGPGSSIRVTLRGEGSLSHDNNEALFVIDGVPLSSGGVATGGSSYSDTDAPVDFGNGAGDLNPDDIESISVLKGPAATALYGSRAANGAIVVTTKSGRETKGIGVSVSSSFIFEKAGYWPDFQNRFGAGSAGPTNTEAERYYSFWTINDASKTLEGETATRNQSRYGFGPEYLGQMFYQYDSYDWDTDTYRKLPWKAQDWYKGFFNTGVTYQNTVTVDGSNGKGTSVRFSFKDVRNDWIVPNTGYDSQNVSIALNSKVSKAVKVAAKVTYMRKNSDNLPTTGYSQASPLYALMWNVPSVSINSYYDEWSSGRIQQMHSLIASTGSTSHGQKLINNGSGSARSENVYWLAYENLNSLDRDRVFGNVSVTATLLPELTLTLRSGIDANNDFRTSRKPQYTYGYADGWYREQSIYNFEMNNDFLLSYKKDFDKGFTLSASLGGNNMVYNYRQTTLTAEKLKTPNIFMMQNSVDRPKVSATRRNKSINSFYGIVSLGWRDMLYLDITGRNDWSSTLAKGNNSYFYPSVSASVLLDQVFKFSDKAPWINMLKVRGSWANVGNDTDPYSIYDYYANSGYSSSYLLPNNLSNYNIKPENIASWEVGLEAKLFQNRWTFDVAYYNSTTTDQIIPVPVDEITGAKYQIINAGEVNNKGVEISTRIQPVRSRNFNWTINLNWAKNWNKVVELAPDVEVWQMNTSTTIGGRVYIYAYPGTELGRIYGFGYERAPRGAYYIDEGGQRIDCGGQVIVNAATGNPELNKSDYRDLGSIYPDWKAGMTHSLSYKNLRLSMAFTAQYGGKCYSVTNFALSYQGKLKNTLDGRYDGLVHPGVNLAEDGTYQKNTTITTNIVDYYNTYVWNRDNAENNVFDTSFLKLKELRLEYSLGKKALSKIGFLQGFSVGVFATNIFCITNFPQYDPEAAALNGASISRGIEQGGYPMTRTYGVTVKLNF